MQIWTFANFIYFKKKKAHIQASRFWQLLNKFTTNSSIVIKFEKYDICILK